MADRPGPSRTRTRGPVAAAGHARGDRMAIGGRVAELTEGSGDSGGACIGGKADPTANGLVGRGNGCLETPFLTGRRLAHPAPANTSCDVVGEGQGPGASGRPPPPLDANLED